MKGGEKPIPVDDGGVFNPNKSNEEIQLTKKPYAPQQQQPIVDLKLYEHQRKPPPPQEQRFPYQMFPQQPIQVLPPTPFQPGTMIPPQNVIHNVYVNTTGLEDHHMTGKVYEDILPLKNFSSSMNTVVERLNLLDYVRSVIFKNRDGTVVPFAKGEGNVWERLKATEFNPYYWNNKTMKDNPYNNLPYGFLMYRSCYPIRTSASLQTQPNVPGSVGGLFCAKDSKGVNLRLYRMTNAEMDVNKNNLNYYDSEVWREILMYEYIRESIIKKKICPNFVTLYGYHMCKDSTIDFDKIGKFNPDNQDVKQEEQYIVKQLPQGLYQLSNPEFAHKNLLIAMTESPTYTLFGWASEKYIEGGKVKTMINSGFHTANIWKSILFQMLAGLRTMQKQKIYFNNFSLLNNVYVKDLPDTGTVTTYWKYNIDGINYYVPNYGYLVLFDSNFSSVKEETSTVKQSEKKHKIISDALNDKNVDYDEKVFEMFLNCFDRNAFDSNFKTNGGIMPPDEVLAMMDSIREFALKMSSTTQPVTQSTQTGGANASKNIGKVIYETMRMYMSNRIGTLLSKQEQEGIIKLDKNFNIGDMVVYEETPEAFTFALYCAKNGSKYHIITADEAGNKLSRNVPIGNIYKYSHLMPIKQKFIPNEAKMEESDLLENYVI